jgi:hypothetical protein
LIRSTDDQVFGVGVGLSSLYRDWQVLEARQTLRCPVFDAVLRVPSMIMSGINIDCPEVEAVEAVIT